MQTYEQTTVDNYAKQILELAIEGIQRYGWWGGLKGDPKSGNLCELQALYRGVEILDVDWRTNNSAVTSGMHLACELLCRANNIHNSISFHNDHELTSGEDAILEFKRAIHLLETQ